MKSHCLIIEDEPLAAERLKEYIERIDSLKLLANYENPLHAMDYLKREAVDLLFLDINLKEISGIKFLESVDFKGKVIITTAYDEYALKGYELDVVDYLLKPYSFERFLKAVTKFQYQQTATVDKDYVFIKTENRYEKVKLDEISYIQGMGDYRQIICQQRKIMTLQTFGELESLLPKSRILRVHKSFMVAISAIHSIKNDRINLSNKVIPISATYKKNLAELLGE